MNETTIRPKLPTRNLAYRRLVQHGIFYFLYFPSLRSLVTFVNFFYFLFNFISTFLSSPIWHTARAEIVSDWRQLIASQGAAIHSWNHIEPLGVKSEMKSCKIKRSRVEKYECIVLMLRKTREMI